MKEELKIQYTILGHNWRIIFVDKDSDKINSKLSGITCYGICNATEHYIFVADNVAEDVVEETLVHELVHAYLGATLHHTENEPEFEEEFVCDFFSAFGAAIISDAEKILKIREEKRRISNGENRNYK